MYVKVILGSKTFGWLQGNPPRAPLSAHLPTTFGSDHCISAPSAVSMYAVWHVFCQRETGLDPSHSLICALPAPGLDYSLHA